MNAALQWMRRTHLGHGGTWMPCAMTKYAFTRTLCPGWGWLALVCLPHFLVVIWVLGRCPGFGHYEEGVHGLWGNKIMQLCGQLQTCTVHQHTVKYGSKYYIVLLHTVYYSQSLRPFSSTTSQLTSHLYPHQTHQSTGWKWPQCPLNSKC